ncbi:UDP-glycosyltransferase 73C3 [Sesamum alatum]|uniref:Glycosyltransferase n=1 Tax=Sesamum alatum TaxID=300844 RepID=A0AAE1YM18_9LAMI|nr:UDP-glycosyltransferase 73C3 [Sesamum alatum]
MASEVTQLHFLLIPLMSQSHIIPLTDFAKLLAQRGVVVSIITTPLNYIRYKASIQHALESGLTIQMLPLEFPGGQVGLPPGCENMDSAASVDLAWDLMLASEILKSPLEEMIEKLDPSPSCIISTSALPWTQQVADNFKIPRYIFETVSCFTLLCAHKLSQARIQETEISDSESFLVPDIPHRVEFTKAQLPAREYSDRVKSFVEQIGKTMLSARGAVVNSFEELEPWYVEGCRKERQRLWCIGPVSLCNKNLAEKSDRGDKASIDEQYCMSWLDSREPRSVIYACFGSLSRISAAQIKEIGLGLEASNCPFIWIIRSLDSSAEVEKWLAEEKFEQRIEGRGLIIRGWAPQVLILSHPSVGGFLTHCGWNSTLEGISAGVPMITWPMCAEQFYNEKFIVDVLKIGLRIGFEVCAVAEQSNALVKWDQVKKSIEKFMDDRDDEGRDRRRRAQKFGEMAKAALEQGGSSYLNITLLIQDVMQACK